MTQRNRRPQWVTPSGGRENQGTLCKRQDHTWVRHEKEFRSTRSCDWASRNHTASAIPPSFPACSLKNRKGNKQTGFLEKTRSTSTPQADGLSLARRHATQSFHVDTKSTISYIDRPHSFLQAVNAAMRCHLWSRCLRALPGTMVPRSNHRLFAPWAGEARGRVRLKAAGLTCAPVTARE